MKKTAIFLLVLCSCAGHQKFVNSVSAHNHLILPDYVNYVKKDTLLGEKERDHRIQAVISLYKLVETERGFKE